MSNNLTRRDFVAGAVASASSAHAANIGTPKKLPARPFGRTGLNPSILALGCGNRLWMAYGVEERGVEAINLALELGINYMDTAQAYGDGKSETWVGKATKQRRKDVILATKTQARTADGVLQTFSRDQKTGPARWRQASCEPRTKRRPASTHWLWRSEPSRFSYPKSACGGSPTNAESNSHPQGIRYNQFERLGRETVVLVRWIFPPVCFYCTPCVRRDLGNVG